MHIPVLLEESISYLNLDSSKRFVDATLNGGGHTLEILKRYPDIKIVGIEYDPDIFSKFLEKEGSDRIVAVNSSYVNLKLILSENNFVPDAILFDLGLSSHHYLSGRGFTFSKDEPLDMRFNPSISITAADIVNTYSQDEIEEILRVYGEEKFSESIAQTITKERLAGPITTTAQLVGIINKSVPNWYKHRKINPATKTFQALRVKVNDEMGNVERGIEAAIEVLPKGGRLAVISFQGQEDKIVREIFKAQAKAGNITWVKRHTIKPTWEEMKSNPRSRSAKMKVIEKS